MHSGTITSSLVAPTALHVDWITKLGTSVATSLSYFGSDFCAWFTLSSHAVSAHPESHFRLCYSHPSSSLLFTTLPSPRTDKHPSSSLWPTPLFLPLSPPDYGTIRKVLSPLNLSTGSCLLEEIELFPPRKRQPIRSLLILHSRSELYVGVRDQVIKIPLKRCSYHKSREWVHVQKQKHHQSQWRLSKANMHTTSF